MIKRIINKKHLVITLKVLFIIASFSFILWKADVLKIWEYIKNTNPFYLVAAYLLMTLAQIVSAGRMRFYFANENLELNRKFSIGLYFTAMLFNTVLPGGIGGDGYKIYTVAKLSGFAHIRAFKIALSERASGLFALLMLTTLFYIFANFGEVIPHQTYVIAGLTLLLIPSYFISIAILLKEKPLTALQAAFYSFPVQLLNVAIAVVLLIDLGVDVNNLGNIMSYLVLFMISSVASIIPISIGGAGLRELTFFYGAKLTGLNSELGVAIAFLFFVINIICSLNGFLFWHRLEKLYQAK